MPEWLLDHGVDRLLTLASVVTLSRTVPGVALGKAGVRWRQRVEQRPWLSAVFVGTSASVGLSPFALVSVAAGSPRIPLPVFLVAGFVGRWAPGRRPGIRAGSPWR